MMQHDWMAANPSKAIKIQDLESMTDDAYLASVTAKNITSAYAKPGI
jgi:hypothetical protein